MIRKVLLLVRGAFNLLFALAVLALAQMQALHGFARGGIYLVVDGLLGLAFAGAMISRHRNPLVAFFAIDGLARLQLGAVILSNPELQGLVLGRAVFFTAVILICVALGIAGLVVAYQEGHSAISTKDVNSMTGPLIAIGLSNLLLALGMHLRFLESDERMQLIAYAFVAGVALVVAGLKWRSSLSRVNA